jgi:hypothetical protein
MKIAPEYFSGAGEVMKGGMLAVSAGCRVASREMYVRFALTPSISLEVPH